MGQGNPALGTMLMRTYLNTLIEADQLPSTIIMYNEGVQLAIDGSDTGKALNALYEKGVEIICCGVCIDFYELKGQVPTNYIGNMYRIIQKTTQASSVIHV